MRDYFTWNGVKSTAHGVHVTEQPDIIVPSERVTFKPVAARSGSLTILEADNVFDDFILSVDCAVSDLTKLHNIGGWLRGSGKLELPEQPGGYYLARVVNQIEFTKVMRGRTNRNFTVTFRCQPFWYASGVADIVRSTPTFTITNPGNIHSEPVITVAGSGDITLMVGLTIVELEGVSGSITIDTPLMEAYKGSESLNSKMAGDFPTLAPGSVPISTSGSVTSVTIKPNWRYLL
jgi:phage-related protein